MAPSDFGNPKEQHGPAAAKTTQNTMGNHEPVEILQISADASMLRADRSTKIDCERDKGLSVVPTFEMASQL